MRIAIDYTATSRRKIGAGAGRDMYVRHLVAAILAQDTSNYYTLLYSGRPGEGRPLPTAENVRTRSIFLPDHYLNTLWYRWHIPLPATIFSGPVDIYHSPEVILPPLPDKVHKITTIHDLAFLEHPEYVNPSLVDDLQNEVPAVLEAADLITTVSHNVKNALIKHYQIPPEKLSVVPYGVGRHFRRITDPILLGATQHKFGLKYPLLLTVGTMEPRKNHVGLIKAFYEIQKKKDAPAMLAIAGDPGNHSHEIRELVTKLKLERKVRFLGHVTDLELVCLYSQADLFVFPSFFEGFGIPVLEAMACGTPVITSNTSVLPEIAGDAALLVDPQHIHAIAQSIMSLLHNETLQEELRQKGYQRAQQYTWAISARQMLSLYQQLYSGEMPKRYSL